MSIRFPVAPGTLLLCDYAMGGFLPPEMVKRRPVVVISPRLPHRDGLCAVVPLSTSPPAKAVTYVVELKLKFALPAPFDSLVVWAKCDMISTVGFRRLDMFRTGRDQNGKRKYLTSKIDPEQLEALRSGVCAGLGINLTLTS
jgi:mRNA interferase MazF